MQRDVRRQQSMQLAVAGAQQQRTIFVHRFGQTGQRPARLLTRRVGIDVLTQRDQPRRPSGAQRVAGLQPVEVRRKSIDHRRQHTQAVDLAPGV